MVDKQVDEQEQVEQAQEELHIIKLSFHLYFIQQQHKQHLEDLIINQQQVVEDEEDEVLILVQVEVIEVEQVVMVDLYEYQLIYGTLQEQ